MGKAEGVQYTEIKISELVELYVIGSELIKITDAQSQDKLAQELRQTADKGLKISKYFLEAFISGTYDFRVYIPEAFLNPNVVTHFHSHPLMLDRHRGPSKNDLGVSNLIGNGIVFQVEDQGMKVIEYRGATSRLLRDYHLK